MVSICKYVYEKDYKNILNVVIEEEWQSFYEERKEEYKTALLNSCTYVLYENSEFAGYIRGITDGNFTLFIAEIIIKKDKRRKGYGKMLINYLSNLYPKTRIDLLSDEDDFYLSMGFHKLGSGMRKHNWY